MERGERERTRLPAVVRYCKEIEECYQGRSSRGKHAADLRVEGEHVEDLGVNVVVGGGRHCHRS
jgi:hypothetical protein